jgi:hypothetical protein
MEKRASDHSGPFVRNSRNCTYHAPHATSSANTIRPAREFGVVLGSEIMKNVKSSSAPFSSRCRGMAIGSPSQIERPKTSAM